MSQGQLSLFSKLPPNLDPKFGSRKPDSGVWDVINDASVPSLQPYYDFQIFSRLQNCVYVLEGGIMCDFINYGVLE